MITSPAWALFESNKQLAETAKITLEEAVCPALKSVPGKPWEAEIGKEDGRTVYEVEIIDVNNKTQKVYVDTQAARRKSINKFLGVRAPHLSARPSPRGVA